jgi:hypothetical protein
MHCNEGMAGHEHGAQQALQSAVGSRALRFLPTRAAGEAARIKLGPAKEAPMTGNLGHLSSSATAPALVGVLQTARVGIFNQLFCGPSYIAAPRELSIIFCLMKNPV